jgi:uncharacterized protein YjbI with pentapeptide repeats
MGVVGEFVKAAIREANVRELFKRLEDVTVDWLPPLSDEVLGIPGQISPDLIYSFSAGLSGERLRSAVLPNVKLSNANLANVDLYRADLRNAELRGARLLDAILAEANLEDANLGGAVLRHALLSNANLRKIVARQANFSDARPF